MTDEYEDAYAGEFKGKLDAEGLLILHLNRLAVYRDTDWKRYCSGVETFILMTPRKIREKGLGKLTELGLRRGSYGSITDDKLVLYDDLYIFVSELIEKHHMIWNIRSVKVFE